MFGLEKTGNVQATGKEQTFRRIRNAVVFQEETSKVEKVHWAYPAYMQKAPGWDTESIEEKSDE